MKTMEENQNALLKELMSKEQQIQNLKNLITSGGVITQDNTGEVQNFVRPCHGSCADLEVELEGGHGHEVQHVPEGILPSPASTLPGREAAVGFVLGVTQDNNDVGRVWRDFASRG